MKGEFYTPELARSAGLPDDRFPCTPEEVNIAETVLSRELERLSLDEHERLLFAIHGIDRSDGDEKEEVESTKDLLMKVDDELKAMDTCNKEAYEQAKRLDASYVESGDFRIMFLRSEGYNPDRAAKKIAFHFEVKRNIFGDGEILARDVFQADLTPDELAALQEGSLQVLPQRDVAGRTVICKNFVAPKRQIKLSRWVWYFMMTVMRDEETQRKGVVLIMYNYQGLWNDIRFQREVHELRMALPQVAHAAHFCYLDESLHPVVTGIRLFMGSRYRFILKPHYGSRESIDFELQTFGIPTESSPMKQDGSWSTAWHEEWLQIHRTREEKEQELRGGGESLSSKDPNIIIPRRFDVLFGKGQQEKLHTGNLRALLLCEMNYGRYESALTGKFGKTAVLERIVRIIHESGGRFLKLGLNGWEEVDYDAARGKIGHFFRHMRSKLRQSEKTPGSLASLEETTGELAVKPLVSTAAGRLSGSKRVSQDT